MHERREYERFSLPLPVTVIQSTERPGHELTRLHDISIGGAAFSLATKLEIGSELDINLHDSDNHLAQALGLQAPPGEPLQFSVNGRVIRQDHHASSAPLNRYAVEFLSPLRISAGAGVSNLRNQQPKHVRQFSFRNGQ